MEPSVCHCAEEDVFPDVAIGVCIGAALPTAGSRGKRARPCLDPDLCLSRGMSVGIDMRSSGTLELAFA